MKFWVSSWVMFNNTNYYRDPPSHTLLFRHFSRFQQCNSHLPRCILRLNYSFYSCQRSLLLLYLPLFTHQTRSVLYILQNTRNLKHWSVNSFHCYSNSLHRLRASLGSNIFLRSHSNYQLAVSYPVYRPRNCTMNLRRVCH